MRRDERMRHILVFNAGSSSLKFALYGVERPESEISDVERPEVEPTGVISPEGKSRGFKLSATLSSGALTGLAGPRPQLNIDGTHEALAGALAPAEAAELIIQRLCATVSLEERSLLGTAHRIVHGGPGFFAPVRLSESNLEALYQTEDLAPLHNPVAFAVVRHVSSRFPKTPLAAVFDTGFFRNLPAVARNYAIPVAWRERYRIRRYGFHGIAHENIVERLRAVRDDGAAPHRLLSMHLGQGCSMTALLDGKPLDTSMGFTPLEGLIMGTRSGDLDPGIVFYLLRAGMDAASIEDVLNTQSGVLGISAASSDMQRLLELQAAGHAAAREAVDAFVYRLRKYAGAYAAVLGGVDVVAFGGGIGERSPEIRARVCAAMQWLGVTIDETANGNCIGADACISAPESACEVRVVAVDEAEHIARVSLPLLC